MNPSSISKLTFKFTVYFILKNTSIADQRNLGMSMRVERSSLDQVKKRFEMNKKKLEERKKDYDIESRVKELKEEEDKLKEYRKEQKRAKKRLHSEISKDNEDSGTQDELSAIMGFSGFGSSKK